MKRLGLFLFVITLPLVAGCDGNNNNGGSASAARLQEILDFESYIWKEIPAGARWEPRAGLQALELDQNFYVFGGRTPNPPMMPNPVPGDSILT